MQTLHNHLWPCFRLCQPNFPECWPVVHSFPRDLLALRCSSLYFLLFLWLKKKLEIDFYILGRAGDRHVTVWTQNAPGSWDSVSYWFCQFAPSWPTVLQRNGKLSWWKDRVIECVFSVPPLTFWTWNQAHLTTHNVSESVQLIFSLN